MKNTGTVHSVHIIDSPARVGNTCSLLGSLLVIIVLVVICNKLIKLFSLNQRDAIYLHLNINKSNKRTMRK